MADTKQQPAERKYTLSINATIQNVTKEQADAIEEAVRQVLDPYDEQVFATKS